MMRLAQASAAVLLGAAMLAAPPARIAAQAPPATEIYLASFAEGPLQTPINISNHPGYDNQPFFLPDSSGVLFSSNRDGQNDIYRYDIATKAIARVTNTPENEYSPTVAPGGDTFTTVRGAEQRLWRFTLDGRDAGLAYAHSGLIGYHAWISPTQLATFILGDKGSPNTLQLIDLAGGAAHTVDENIGRSLHVRPGRGTVSYVHRPRGAAWTIKEVDPATRQTRIVTPAIEGIEDLTWTPSGAIIMGSKSKLFRWTADEQRWIEIADLGDAGIRAITRLAVSPDGRWIAIVSTPAAK